MTTLSEYISSIKKYADENALAVLEGLTEAQFARVKEASESIGYDNPGIDIGVTKTHETLANWDNSRATSWTECRRSKKGDDFRHYEGVQMFKGQPRMGDIMVVDLGDFRIVLS